MRQFRNYVAIGCVLAVAGLAGCKPAEVSNAQNQSGKANLQQNQQNMKQDMQQNAGQNASKNAHPEKQGQ